MASSTTRQGQQPLFVFNKETEIGSIRLVILILSQSNNMNHANDINGLFDEMRDNVSEENKDKLVPRILRDAIRVWEDYMASKLKLSLSEKDFQLHVKMMKRLWNLARRFNPSEKIEFPINKKA